MGTVPWIRGSKKNKGGWDVLSTLVMEHQQGPMGIGDFLRDSTVRLGLDVRIYATKCGDTLRLPMG